MEGTAAECRAPWDHEVAFSGLRYHLETILLHSQLHSNHETPGPMGCPNQAHPDSVSGETSVDFRREAPQTPFLDSGWPCARRSTGYLAEWDAVSNRMNKVTGVRFQVSEGPEKLTALWPSLFGSAVPRLSPTFRLTVIDVST